MGEVTGELVALFLLRVVLRLLVLVGGGAVDRFALAALEVVEGSGERDLRHTHRGEGR